MSLFLSRSKRAGRFLVWKVRLFVVGGTLTLGGIYLDEQWLTLVAIPVLIAGVALRFSPVPSEEDAAAEEVDPPDQDSPSKEGEA